MNLADHIEVNPQITLGKPVIRGTRIPVELVLRKLSEGATEQTLVEAYPQLTPAGIQAALAYAAEALSLDHSETRFRLRAKRGHGKAAQGLASLKKAAS